MTQQSSVSTKTLFSSFTNIYQKKKPCLKRFQFKQTRQTEGIKQRHRGGRDSLSDQLLSRKRPTKHILIYENTAQHFSVTGGWHHPTERLKWGGKNPTSHETERKTKTSSDKNGQNSKKRWLRGKTFLHYSKRQNFERFTAVSWWKR